MLVYDGIKTDFIKSVEDDLIATEIETKIRERLGKRTSPNEFRSWENSLEYMYKVLQDAKIPDDSGIAIEYNIPQTSKRIDFLISGYDKTGGKNVAIIELKQWNQIERVPNVDALVKTRFSQGMREHVHPSYQAWSYAQLIRDYNSMVQDRSINLHPCVCMHNYVRGENDPIDHEQYAAYCSVFFIDESQRVTLKDIGSVEAIKSWAEQEGAEVIEMELMSQFRCNGSDGYLAWLDQVLDIRETANYTLDGIDFDFRICSSPSEVKKLIFEKNKAANRARMVVGYCWNWEKTQANNTDYHDIKIGDFEMSWNLRNGEPFAISETSVNEIGCIHTSQGLEFDYVGVIIGDDLRFENGKVITDFTKRARTDQSLKGIKTLYENDPKEAEARADEIIKNTYRTLLTRGMKGCYVYCTNEPLADYLRNRLYAYKTGIEGLYKA